jgi:hypothetical protein
MYFLVIKNLLLGRATAVSPSSISSASSQSCDISASHSATLSVSKPVVASQLIGKTGAVWDTFFYAANFINRRIKKK